MKKFLFACTIAAISLVVPAFAEYCGYNDPCQPCQPCQPYDCCADFSGFYVGGNVGVFTNTAHRTDLDGFFEFGGTRSVNRTNVTAGVLLGYDWAACSNTLFGFVADWNWVNTDRHDSNTIFTGAVVDCRERFDWFTTIRGRIGLTVCDTLVYTTLGAAVFSHEFKGNGTTDFHHCTTRWGWTGGFGTEFMVGCNWSLGAEVLLLAFDHHENRFTFAGTSFRIGHSDIGYVGRVILNWRLGNLFCF